MTEAQRAEQRLDDAYYAVACTLINVNPQARVLARVEAWRDLKDARPTVNLNKIAFMRIYARTIEPDE